MSGWTAEDAIWAIEQRRKADDPRNVPTWEAYAAAVTAIREAFTAQAEAARWESIARTLALRHGLREELAALAAAEATP